MPAGHSYTPGAVVGGGAAQMLLSMAQAQQSCGPNVAVAVGVGVRVGVDDVVGVAVSTSSWLFCSAHDAEPSKLSTVQPSWPHDARAKSTGLSPPASARNVTVATVAFAPVSAGIHAMAIQILPSVPKLAEPRQPGAKLTAVTPRMLPVYVMPKLKPSICVGSSIVIGTATELPGIPTTMGVGVPSPMATTRGVALNVGVGDCAAALAAISNTAIARARFIRPHTPR